MNKKVKIIIICAVALIFIAIGSYLNLTTFQKSDKKNTEPTGTELRLQDSKDSTGMEQIEKKAIKVCKTMDEKCMIKDLIYPHAYLNTKIKEVNSFIELINSRVDEYYTKTKQADIEKSSCKDLSKKGYLKDSYIPVGITSYIDDNYISISLDSRTVDVCNNKVTENPYLIGVYDKKNKKMLTQEEIAVVFNVTKEIVHEALKKEAYDENTKQEAFKLPEINNLNYQLFLSEDGKITAASLVSDSANKNFYYEIALN